jgi:hypothetical protein
MRIRFNIFSIFLLTVLCGCESLDRQKIYRKHSFSLDAFKNESKEKQIGTIEGFLLYTKSNKIKFNDIKQDFKLKKINIIYGKGNKVTKKEKEWDLEIYIYSLEGCRNLSCSANDQLWIDVDRNGEIVQTHIVEL